MGDNTNYVITFAGELLNQAAELIKSGLKTPEIADVFTTNRGNLGIVS